LLGLLGWTEDLLFHFLNSMRLFNFLKLSIMKKYFLLIFALHALQVFSQSNKSVLKFKAIHLSAYELPQKDNDTAQSFDCNYLVILNFKEDKIQIYTPSTPQVFDIVKYFPEEKDPKLKTEMISFGLIDEEGHQCLGKFGTMAKTIPLLTIEYGNFRYVYILAKD
jgi:hypothetical protein